METAKEILEKDGLTEHEQNEGYILKVQDIVNYMEKYHESKVKEKFCDHKRVIPVQAVQCLKCGKVMETK
jgi:hypothetical protein